MKLTLRVAFAAVFIAIVFSSSLGLAADPRVHAQMVPDDSSYDLQWAYLADDLDLGVETAWDLNHSAKNITIAIIDSGADLSHEDISANLWKNPGEIPGNGIDDDANGYVDDVNGYDFLNHDSDPWDDNGHGTMVFGILAAVGDNSKGVSGMVWDGQIMVLKVLDDTGVAHISTTIEAIDYAITQKVKIINLSWGYVPNGTPSAPLEEAIGRAQDAGILVVTSAGNVFDGNGADNDQDPEQANYPSSFSEENIIAVAATNQSDDLADFSNYGYKTVDIAAPGVSIYTTSVGNSYEFFNGTSAATPLVSGAAALVWAMNPDLDYRDVKKLLMDNVDPLPSLQGKIYSGGRLNVGDALLASPNGGGTFKASTASSADPSTSSASAGGCSLQKYDDQSSKILPLLMVGILILGGTFLSRRSSR